MRDNYSANNAALAFKRKKALRSKGVVDNDLYIKYWQKEHPYELLSAPLR
ncbi:hypothetical protein [Pseudoalteromonas rubra]|nr:hypothetical protein [Pseudoalteromonas rubra]